MGEYADMYLEGDVCHDCGVYLPGESPGHPRWCRDCRRSAPHSAQPTGKLHAICPECKKRVKLTGLSQHTKDKHGR